MSDPARLELAVMSLLSDSTPATINATRKRHYSSSHLRNVLKYIYSWSDYVEVMVVELWLLCCGVTRGTNDMVASTVGYKLPSDMYIS